MDAPKFPLVTLSLLLMIVLSVGAFTPLVVQAQEIQREDVMYFTDAWGPPTGWNPMIAGQNTHLFLMYDTLFLYSTRDDVWIPWVAESYTWVDAYTFEVKMRAEAKWWDGTPLTAEDVEFTYDLAKKYVLPFASADWDFLEEVKAIDDHTVQFITSEEKLNYFNLLGTTAGNNQAILPKHRWEPLEEELGAGVLEFMDDDPAEIVGSGPYRLHSWTEDLWYYERVDDWWGKDIFGLPGPKYLAHKTFKDNPAACLAFEMGEVDAMGHFVTAVYELWEVKKLARRTYYAESPYYIGSGVIHLYINYAEYPLKDLAVRRAVANAIPYDDLVNKAYFGYSVRASPAGAIYTVPTYAQWIDDSLVEEYWYELDLDEAKRILDDADIIDRDGDGVREMPDGTKLGPYTIAVPYGWTDWMMMCDMISVNLGEIGIDVATEFPDFTVWYDNLATGEFDFMISWDADMGFSHPWNTYRFVMDPRLTGPVGEIYPAGNWERYMNWEVIPLIDAVAKETDPEKLKTAYSSLQEMYLRDLPAIPLFYGAAWYEYSEDYWVGWPREEDPRWFSPYPWNYPNNIPTMFGLSKKAEGEKPMPAWVEELAIPTTKIFEDLAEAIAPPGPETVTITKTTTKTTSVVTTETKTVEKEVPTLEPISITAAGIIALIAGLAVGWIGGKRRKP